MFEAHKDHGRVLLAVRVRSTGWTVFVWAVTLGWTGLAGFVLLKPHALARPFEVIPNLAGAVVAIFGYLRYPRIKFYEGGVEIPPTRDYNRPRYLRWDQVERYSWDGDRLVVTGTSSVLAGGPVEGGVVRIPASEHLAVEQVMGTQLPVR